MAATEEEAKAEEAEGDAEAEAKDGQEGKKAEEGEGGAELAGGSAHKRRGCLPFKFGGLCGDTQEDQMALKPEDRNRHWDLIVSIRQFSNVTSDPIRVFFALSLNSNEPKTHRCKVRLVPVFTSIFTLGKMEAFSPDNPIIMIDRKTFVLSYKELTKHVFKVDMWKAKCWTFNEYFGVKKTVLQKISNEDPNMTLLLRKKLSKADMADKKKAKMKSDVAMFKCTVNLEEIFDFELACDNWTLELDKNNEDFKKFKAERKRLRISMPKDSRSIPGERGFLGGASSQVTEWNQEEGRFFWPSCGKFTFRGTRTQLCNSYFIVTVLTGSPPAAVAENKIMQDMEKKAPVVSGRLLGRCLMNLTSVLDISVFQGKVKQFTPDKKRYIVGMLKGNVKCTLKSKGFKDPEHDFRGERPMQLKTATTVSHLTKTERYLVVKVNKCEALPIADVDVGTSDPYIRASWDSMVMLSPVVKETLRPSFKQTFFFPVRIVFPELRMGSKGERTYQDTILTLELENKGPLKIDIWDDDTTSADFLGGVKVNIGDILEVRGTQERNLLGPVKPEKATDDDQAEFVEEKKGLWYEAVKDVRVFDGTKRQLSGSLLPSKEPAYIYYEAYFFPDWAEGLRFKGTTDEDDHKDAWEKRYKDWEKSAEKFYQEYALPFPDSIGAYECGMLEEIDVSGGKLLRRFPAYLKFQREGTEPLMSLVSPIIIPESFSYPATLLDWVNCLTFETAAKQLRTGIIPLDGWKDPEYILARRKGAPQDHAVLLCSLLLGCKKDAYVCKGTVLIKEDGQEKLAEHTWVMTREDGWVVFWETSNRQLYHLPNRYDKSRARKGKKKGKKKDTEEVDEEAKKKAEMERLDREELLADDEEEAQDRQVRWDCEVEDSRIRPEDMDALPIVSRMPKPKERGKQKKKEKTGREELKEMLLQMRQHLPIAPSGNMLTDDNLVTWLPYDSIDIIFNGTNLWANRGNHHPACIHYDFDEVEGEEGAQKSRAALWEPLIRKTELEELTYSPLCPNVSVQPEIKPNIIDDLREELRTEIIQNLQLTRDKKGWDTIFDHNEELVNRLSMFLEIQELFRLIDPDADGPKEALEAVKHLAPGLEVKEERRKVHKFIVDACLLKTWNKHGSIYFLSAEQQYVDYKKDQQRKWEELEEKVREFLKKDSKSFPTKRGKKFNGFPVHFSTCEHESVRTYLSELQEYENLRNTKEEGVQFTVVCSMFSRLGGILSVWLYIGIQSQLTEDEV